MTSKPTTEYGREVIGWYGRMLRSDGKWYDIRVEDYEPTDKRHLVRIMLTTTMTTENTTDSLNSSSSVVPNTTMSSITTTTTAAASNTSSVAWYDLNDPRRNIQWYPTTNTTTTSSSSSSHSSSTASSIHSSIIYNTSLKALGSQDNTKLSHEEQSKLHDEQQIHSRSNVHSIDSTNSHRFPSSTVEVSDVSSNPPTLPPSNTSEPITNNPSASLSSSAAASSVPSTAPTTDGLSSSTVTTTPPRRASKSGSSANNALQLQQPKVPGKVIYAHSDGLYYAFAPNSTTRKLPVYLLYPRRPVLVPPPPSSSSSSSTDASTVTATPSTSVAPPKPRPSLPLLPPEGGWRALQSKVSIDDDPKEILYRRIRIFWPLDNEWYSGRILRYHAPTQEHFIRFDDGDERWYNLDDREYIIVDEYEHQLDGQKITIEAVPHQWYTAHILQYDPLLDMHHIRWLDGNTVPVMESSTVKNTNDSKTEAISSSLVSSSPSLTYPLKNTEELTNLHLRNHFVLVDITTLPAGEPILGRRVTVYLPDKHDIATGTITDYTLSHGIQGGTKNNKSPVPPGIVSNSVTVPTHTEGKENDTNPTRNNNNDMINVTLTAPGTPGSSSFSLLVGLGTSLTEGIRPSFSSLTNPQELELPPPSSSVLHSTSTATATATISPMPKRTDDTLALSNPLLITNPHTPLPDRSPSLPFTSSPLPYRSSSHVGPSPLLLPLSPLLNRTPSYMPRPIQPDPDATVKIIFDEGEKMISSLRNLSFTWLPYKIPGTPKGPGLVGLVNLGNTCYLNAILQVLGRIDSLTAYCLDDSFINQIKIENKWGMQGRMAMSYSDILRHLWGETCIALAPAFIKGLLSEKNTTFNGLGQQDAHEALLCLLDGIHEDLAVPDHIASKAAEEDAQAAAIEDEQDKADKAALALNGGTNNGSTGPRRKFGASFLSSLFGGSKKVATETALSPGLLPVPNSSTAVTVSIPPKKYIETTSIVKQLFFVQTMAEFVCSKHRKHVQYRHGPRGGEMLPPLPLAPKQSIKTSFFKQKRYRNPQLLDCLNNFFTTETVERKCSHCNKPVTMSTRPWLKNLPPVLVIQLKRFEYSMVTNEYCKLSDPIAFPLRGLDMGPYVYPSKTKTRSDSEPKKHKHSSGSNSSIDTGTETKSNVSSGTTASIVTDKDDITPSNPSSKSKSTLLSSFSTPLHRTSSHEGTNPTNDDDEEDNGTIYDLFGVVCHMGSSERGHYTVFARNTSLSYGKPDTTTTNENTPPSSSTGTTETGTVPLPPTWYYYDDTQVYQIREEELSSERVSMFAYLLFYVKRLPGTPVPPLPPPSSLGVPPHAGTPSNTVNNTSSYDYYYANEKESTSSSGSNSRSQPQAISRTQSVLLAALSSSAAMI